MRDASGCSLINGTVLITAILQRTGCDSTLSDAIATSKGPARTIENIKKKEPGFCQIQGRSNQFHVQRFVALVVCCSGLFLSPDNN